MHILRIDKSGNPQEWLSIEKAAALVTKKAIIYTVGNNPIYINGGINQFTKSKSGLVVYPIISCDGELASENIALSLNNKILYRRDCFTCAYCSRTFPPNKLSRDHVFPKSRGGLDIWENVVTSCRPCNSNKCSMLVEEMGVTMQYTPFKPNLHEYFALKVDVLTKEQVMFLQPHFKNDRMVNRFHTLEKSAA